MPAARPPAGDEVVQAPGIALGGGVQEAHQARAGHFGFEEIGQFIQHRRDPRCARRPGHRPARSRGGTADVLLRRQVHGLAARVEQSHAGLGAGDKAHVVRGRLVAVSSTPYSSSDSSSEATDSQDGSVTMLPSASTRPARASPRIGSGPVSAGPSGASGPARRKARMGCSLSAASAAASSAGLPSGLNTASSLPSALCSHRRPWTSSKPSIWPTAAGRRRCRPSRRLASAGRAAGALRSGTAHSLASGAAWPDPCPGSPPRSCRHPQLRGVAAHVQQRLAYRFDAARLAFVDVAQALAARVQQFVAAARSSASQKAPIGARLR